MKKAQTRNLSSERAPYSCSGTGTGAQATVPGLSAPGSVARVARCSIIL